MPNFRLENVAYEHGNGRQGVRVDITLAGPSGRFAMDIRIIIPASEDFTSTRTIEFVDGKAKLIMTPFSRLPDAQEGVIHLRVEGQDLPPVPAVNRDGNG
jgi:hypothetical protein